MSRDDELGPDGTDADGHDAPRDRGSQDAPRDRGDDQPSTPAPAGRAARRKAERRAAAADTSDASTAPRARRADRGRGDDAPAEAGRSRTGPVQFLREVRSELRKVAWPSRRELLSYTLVVLSFSLVVTLLTWGFDETIRNAIINTLG